MSDPKSVLKKFWGYDQFRPLQLEIVESVLAGYDTLAILPTGGGKSICFQVPAMVMDGLAIVVTPLIALMQDQVHRLQGRGIAATAIFSGMSRRAIENSLDACEFGGVKFLYVSPERLKTESFLERIKNINVKLLAIDEAHCISQWGYDFRPPYLEIADFRKKIKSVVCIALTASAPEVVRKDIAEKLELVNHKSFVKSFSRPNLSYSVVEETTKYERLLSVLEKVPGTAIVYVRSRERTQRIAAYLQENRISADFYHAGLNLEQRTQKQKDWISGKVRVIAATNAFGMGIDKPDVRLVVHMDLPESIEAYYQEAGRAGRDEKKSFALVLFNEDDVVKLKENIERRSPEPTFLNLIYKKICNFYKIASGTGQMTEFEFDLAEFCKYAETDKLKTHYALNRLQQIGLINIDDPSERDSKLHIVANKNQLYLFEVAHSGFSELINLLLRNYSGILSLPVRIDEGSMAKKLGVPIQQVVQSLEFIDKNGIAIYQKKIQHQILTLLLPRIEPAIQAEFKRKLLFLYQRQQDQTQSMLNYAKETEKCRSTLILNYFDEWKPEPCGVCDFCVKEKKRLNYPVLLSESKEKILKITKKTPLTFQSLKLHFSISEIEVFEEALRQLNESGKVEFDSMGKIWAR